MRSLWAVAITASLLALAACSSTESDDASTPEGSEGSDGSELRSDGTSRVNLNFEGTCQFLRNCSSFSKNAPKPNMVRWGCEGWQVCSDDDMFIAAPSRVVVDGKSRRACGLSVEVCRPNGKCVIAVVRDVSDRSVWEASPGVLNALGLPHGLTGRCSGYGGGSVTIKARPDIDYATYSAQYKTPSTPSGDPYATDTDAGTYGDPYDPYGYGDSYDPYGSGDPYNPYGEGDDAGSYYPYP